jgi:hypothetical protein
LSASFLQPEDGEVDAERPPGCRAAPTILPRVRRAAVLLSLLVLALVSCGGGDDGEGVEDILDQAFRQEISSADLQVEAELDLNGGEGDSRPVRIEATGPFRTNENRIPSVDIDLRIGSDGAGQTIQTGFLSTGDRAFVKFQDVYYEQPRAQVRRANRQIAKNSRRRSSLRSLGLDPRSWLGEATDEGGEEVAGVETRHVAGTLAVEPFMRNLNEFVRRSGSAIGGATGQSVPEPLSAEDIRRVGEVVRDPSFDIYVGDDDDIIRRVSGRIEFEVPEASRDSFGGLESGTFTFSVELRDVNGDQEIEAPANARPLSDLTESLGAGTLGLGTQEPESGSGGQAPAGEGDAPDAGSGQEVTPSDDGDGSPEADAFRAYEECLDKARPEDTEALQDCADLLQTP